MKTMTATEIVRQFSRLLTSLESGHEEITVIRNRHPVARILPGSGRMTALEALADIYRTIPQEDADTWLKDSRLMEKRLTGKVRDPWA